VVFLAGGTALLVAAIALFGWAMWRDVRAGLLSITNKAFAPGEVIYRQGDPAEHVFVITTGRVEAVFSDPAKGEIVLGQLGPEEYFGEAGILSDVPRQATVRAIDSVQLVAIHRTHFLRLYGSLSGLRARVDRQQSKRGALLARKGAG